MRLGELLISKGLLSEKQLLAGLTRHYRSHEKLGECLILEGAISESAMLQALSEQLTMPYFDVIPAEWLTKSALALIPGATAKKWCVISGENEKGVMVFFNDNLEQVKSLMDEKGQDTRFGLAKKSEIRRALDKYLS